jgi:hypothetical protein
MSEKKVLIFGTGQFAQIIKRYLEEQGRVLAGFTVNKSCISGGGGGIPLRDNRKNISALGI